MNVAANLKSLEPTNSVYVSSILSEYTAYKLLDGKDLNCYFSFIFDDCDSVGAFKPVSDIELIKTRVVDIKDNKQLLRIDNRFKFAENYIQQYKEYLLKTLFIGRDFFNKFDCIVISDYCKGLIDEEIILKLHEYSGGKIFVDTKKKDLSYFDFDSCILKINSKEYIESINREKIKTMILTKGKSGCSLMSYNNCIQSYSCDIVENGNPIGAGDSFLAGLVVEYLRDGNLNKSIEFANRVASFSVRKFGTCEVRKEEVQ